MKRSATLATMLTISLGVAACSTTTVDLDTGSETGSETGSAPNSAGEATAADAAGISVAELLPELAELMSQLSFQIAADGDEKATLANIDSIWIAIRPELETTRPELLSGIDVTVDMARTAVVRIRPADADKAYQILSNIIESYNAGS